MKARNLRFPARVPETDHANELTCLSFEDSSPTNAQKSQAFYSDASQLLSQSEFDVCLMFGTICPMNLVAVRKPQTCVHSVLYLTTHRLLTVSVSPIHISHDKDRAEHWP